MSSNTPPGPGSGRKVGLLEVASRDGIAFTAALVLVMNWVMMLVIVISIAAGGRKPTESPGEIALGMALITGVLLAIIVLRRNAIARRLRAWTPVPAEIYHSAQVQFFITVGLKYTWRGSDLKRTVQVPYRKHNKFLIDRKEVTVLVDPERPRRLMIGEVYGKGKEGLRFKV